MVRRRAGPCRPPANSCCTLRETKPHETNPWTLQPGALTCPYQIEIRDLVGYLGVPPLASHPRSPHLNIIRMRSARARDVKAGKRLGSDDQTATIINHIESANEPGRQLPVTMTGQPDLFDGGSTATKRRVPCCTRNGDLVASRARIVGHSGEYRARAPYTPSPIPHVPTIR